MYDTAERLRRAKRAARQLVRRQERKALRRLGTLCAALALALTGALTHFAGSIPGTVQGAYGATLLADSAGGYVLVAVAAFVTAVALTVIYMRLHERDKRNRDGDYEETKPPTADQ